MKKSKPKIEVESSPKSPEPPKASGPVKMVRSEEDAKGGPTTADVHPSEVESWEAAGWKIKEKGD